MEASKQTFEPFHEDTPDRALRPVGDRYAREVLALDDGSGITRLALMLEAVLERFTEPEPTESAGP